MGKVNDRNDVEPKISKIEHANFEGFASHIQTERTYILAYTLGGVHHLPPSDVPATTAMPVYLIQKLTASLAYQVFSISWAS